MSLVNLKTISFIVCGSLLLISCSKQEQGKMQMPPASVTVMTVKPESVGAEFEATGTAEAFKSVQVRARVDGFLDKRIYKEGGFVKEGTVMFSMDQKPFEVALMSAKASLAQAEANERKVTRELERVKQLYDVKAVSHQDLDNAIAANEAGLAAKESAKASVAAAELNLGYTQIKAPTTGYADKAIINDGSYISPAQNGLLTTVSQIDPIYVNFSLPESQYLGLNAAIKSGRLFGKNEKIEIMLSDGSKFDGAGRVDFSAPVFDTSTGTMSFRAEIRNPKGTLKPGQFVRVKLTGATWKEAILLPQRALLQGQKGRFVIAVEGGKAAAKPIELGEWIGDRVIVKNGLKAGDVVAVDGIVKAMPGMPVKVMGEALPSSGAPIQMPQQQQKPTGK